MNQWMDFEHRIWVLMYHYFCVSFGAFWETHGMEYFKLRITKTPI